jgi:hypothetical protein
MRFSQPLGERDGTNRLRTQRQIDLYVEREKAKRTAAERREVEARVRQLNFDLIQQAAFLAIAIGIGISLIAGAVANPDLLGAGVFASSAFAALIAALHRLASKSRH